MGGGHHLLSGCRSPRESRGGHPREDRERWGECDAMVSPWRCHTGRARLNKMSFHHSISVVHTCSKEDAHVHTAMYVIGWSQ